MASVFENFSSRTGFDRLSPLEKAAYIFTTAFVVLFLVASILVIGRTERLSDEESISFIQQATSLTCLEVDEHISEEFGTLHASAVLPENRSVIDEDGTFGRLTKRLGDYNSYVRIGVADKNGNALWVDSSGTSHGDVTTSPYFKRAVQGEDVVTDSYFDAASGIEVNYYAVPIRMETTNEIVGVLFAADPTQELHDIVERSLYAGKGFAHIIDAEGNYIVPSDSPLVASSGETIFNVDPPLPPEVVKFFLTQFAQGETGYIQVPVEGIPRFVSFEPLSYNNWYLLYSIPQADVHPIFSEFLIILVALIVGAVIVFVLFIILIWRGTYNSRKHLEHIAFVDPVTGRDNYQKFLIDAKDILDKNKDKQYVVCYEDIKGFKYINDLFGRETGTRLLKYWSDGLAELSFPNECFARVRDDTFVSLRICSSKSDLRKRYISLMHKLEVFPDTFASGYKVGWRCGAYIIGLDNGKLPIEDMVDRASLARDTIKWSDSTDHIAFYSEDIRKKRLWDASIESHMENALEAGEFKVYMQPKVSLDEYDITGVEALVRWQSPEHGFLSPAEFIGLFERNGFIVDVDRFVFEQVCKHYRETVLDNGQTPYIFSVNVSRRSLMQIDFISSYAEIKNRYDIPDGVIELEFTESLAVNDVEHFKTTVAICHSIGFLCSIDDFGSGYSSLNMLKSLQVDVLKLDRLFFDYEPGANRGRSWVKRFIDLAKDLGMKTVAEGIDEKWQVDELSELHCDMIQGYYFSKPMPLEDFNRFRSEWREGAR